MPCIPCQHSPAIRLAVCALWHLTQIRTSESTGRHACDPPERWQKPQPEPDHQHRRKPGHWRRQLQTRDMTRQGLRLLQPHTLANQEFARCFAASNNSSASLLTSSTSPQRLPTCPSLGYRSCRGIPKQYPRAVEPSQTCCSYTQPALQHTHLQWLGQSGRGTADKKGSHTPVR